MALLFIRHILLPTSQGDSPTEMRMESFVVNAEQANHRLQSSIP